MACKDSNDYTQCDLVIDEIIAKFGGLMERDPKSKSPQMTHHNVEIKTRCIDCDRVYWFSKADLKVEDFGQIWRTAVFSKQYKND